jgi:hypothetical protein
MRDLRELLDEACELPIGGVTYRVPPPSAAKGLVLQRMSDLIDIAAAGGQVDEASMAELKLDGQQEVDFYRNNLGTAYDEMLSGDVTLPEIKVAAGYAFLFWTKGRDIADAYWEAQQSRPPVKAPTDRKPSTKKARKKPAPRKTATAGASSTPSPSSGSGTRPRLRTTPTG